MGEHIGTQPDGHLTLYCGMCCRFGNRRGTSLVSAPAREEYFDNWEGKTGECRELRHKTIAKKSKEGCVKKIGRGRTYLDTDAMTYNLPRRNSSSKICI